MRDSTTGTSPTTRASQQTSRRRIYFRIIVVLFLASLLPGIEVLLSLNDVGADTTLIVRAHRIPGPSYYLNPQADIAYCMHDLRGPEPRAFELPKPSGKFRVLVVGASTVQGYPYSSELSFPRQMELVLQRQLKATDVEVLNAGIVGLSSLPLVDVVRQGVKAEPDVIVVYTGHNEFYGVGGVSTNATVSQLSIHARRYRLIQALTAALFSGPPPTGELISRLPKDIEVPVNSPLRTQAEHQYETCLTSMSQICERARIPLILCGVTSNLRDQSPLPQPVNHHNLQEDIERVQRLDVLTLDRDAILDLMPQLLTLLEHEPSNAALHYRLAQCYEQSGEKNAARCRFKMARDDDLCRYRAPRSFREIASRVAERFSQSGVHYVDLEPAFTHETQFAAPGHDLFLEHVHFNTAGNWLIAQTVAASIVEKVLSHSWNESLVPNSQERDQWLGLLVEDELVARTLAGFLTESPPFDRVIDLKHQQLSLKTEAEQFATSLPPARRRLYDSLNGKTRIDDLIDGMGRACLDEGHPQQALQLFELGQRRRPWMPNSQVFAAIALHRLHRDEQAAKVLDGSDHVPLPASPALAKVRNQLSRQLSSVSGGR